MTVSLETQRPQAEDMPDADLDARVCMPVYERRRRLEHGLKPAIVGLCLALAGLFLALAVTSDPQSANSPKPVEEIPGFNAAAVQLPFEGFTAQPYSAYFNDCMWIYAFEHAIDGAETLGSNAADSALRETAALNAAIYISQRNMAARQYNSAAALEDSAEPFNRHGLPHRVAVEYEPFSGKVDCQ